MAGFQNRCKSIAKTAFIAFSLAVAFALPAHAAYLDGFEQGGTFFDDGVGVVHIRPSKSKTETDYAPGIPASQGNNYARLLVQAWLQNGCFTDTSGNSFCGINGSQAPNGCRPGGLESDNSVNCDGPLTEWGLPYGHFDKGVRYHRQWRDDLARYLPRHQFRDELLRGVEGLSLRLGLRSAR